MVHLLEFSEGIVSTLLTLGIPGLPELSPKGGGICADKIRDLRCKFDKGVNAYNQGSKRRAMAALRREAWPLRYETGQAHERPSDARDTKIAALRLKFNAFKSLEGEKVNENFKRLKCLLNDLENNSVTIPKAEVSATFVNCLPRKWLSMNQTQRENNSIKNDSLATLYGKYTYEEGLIDQIYESETQSITLQASSSKALISNNQFQDSDSDVEEDQRTNNEFMADLNAEYHERSLLENQKRFYKRIDDMTKGKSKKGKKDKEKSKKGLLAESFDWDDEYVSSDDERSTKIRAFMAIAEDEPC
nr:hypothetical protein [Tanacetum cinerariifolium]